MSYGVTDTGFVIKPIEASLADIEARQLDEISPTLDLNPTSLLGVQNGIVAAAASELWEVLGALYNGMDVDNAVDDQLANLALLSGTKKLPAFATVIEGATVNVDAGFHAEPGEMFATVVGDTTHLFYNLDAVDNPAGIAADIDVDFICQDAGAIQAIADTMTVIATPLTGWNSVTNEDDGILGAPIEVDAQLRIRRQLELTRGGNATADALAADVLAKMQPDQDPPTSVATTNVTVLYNDTEETDADGVPPHSLEVIARAPGATEDDDQLLANLIFGFKAAGDGTSGTLGATVTDAKGNEKTVRYTRPDDVPLYVNVTVVKDPKTFPADGETQIKVALATFAQQNYQPGSKVYRQRLADAIFPRVITSTGTDDNGDPITVTTYAGVKGVVDWTVFQLGTAPSPVGTTNIDIAVRQCATLSTSDIAVTVT